MTESTGYSGSEISRGKIVPLISSYVAGPLGLLHLPRLWLKGLLHATGALAEDWGCGPGGLDKRIMDHVGIDGAAFVPWLLQTFPTYAECEAWVRENARTLDDRTIARSNDELTAIPLPRGLGPQFRRYLELDDDVEVGIMLNNLDDWMAVYQYVAKWRNGLDAIVPAISPSTSGPLGVMQLPRLWVKRLFASAGALPAEYPLVEEAADRSVLEALGINPSAAAKKLSDEPSTYVRFESWIRQRLPDEPATIIAAANRSVRRDATFAAEACDWDLLHRSIGERRRAAPQYAPAQLLGIRPFNLPIV